MISIDMNEKVREKEVNFYRILQKIETKVERKDVINILKKMIRENTFCFQFMEKRGIKMPYEDIKLFQKFSIYTDCSIIFKENGKLRVKSYTVGFDDTEDDEEFSWTISICTFELSDCELNHLLGMKIENEDVFEDFLVYYQSL